jgi:hypothetical protein
MVVTLVTRKDRGFCGLVGTLTLALLGGCGGVEARPHDDGSGAAGGQSSDSDAPALEVHETELASGACGVVRRIRLPRDVQSSYGIEAPFAWQRGGFSVGPWNSGETASVVNALWLEPDQRTFSSFEASGSPNDNHWSTFLGSSQTAVDVYVDGQAGGAFGDSWNTRAWSAGQTTPTAHGRLLTAEWRGTDGIITMPSLSGDAAVFAIWPRALSEPRAALIGSRGAPLGEARSLAPADHRYARCPAVTPTEHGGIVSFIDTSDPNAEVLRLVELSTEPAALDESLPVTLDDSTCPVLTYDGRGVLLLRSSVATGRPATLERISHGHTSESTVSLSGAAIAVTELQGAPLVLEQQAHGAALEWLTSPSPISADVPPEIQVIHPIAGAPGSLFLYSLPLDGPHEIVQLSCR